MVYVKNRYFVSTKENSFRFYDLVKKEEKYIPFDDVSILIFEHRNSFFSMKLINTCVKENILLLFCDEKHSPLVLFSNVYGQNQRMKKLKSQLAISSKAKKRIWRKIVIGKINNQADCLIQVAKKVDEGKMLQLVGKQVEDGDVTNREAYAARRYFLFLFGNDFKRGRYSDLVNSCLNYGYALLRAVIRKELVIHGLEPSWGIHHESTENPFNLSDDLIEPFRPFVDLLVYENFQGKDTEILDDEGKKSLFQIFFTRCVIDGKVYSVADAVPVMVNSYLACLEKDSASPLKIPVFAAGGI